MECNGSVRGWTAGTNPYIERVELFVLVRSPIDVADNVQGRQANEKARVAFRGH